MGAIQEGIDKRDREQYGRSIRKAEEELRGIMKGINPYRLDYDRSVIYAELTGLLNMMDNPEYEREKELLSSTDLQAYEAQLRGLIHRIRYGRQEISKTPRSKQGALLEAMAADSSRIEERLKDTIYKRVRENPTWDAMEQLFGDYHFLRQNPPGGGSAASRIGIVHAAEYLVQEGIWVLETIFYEGQGYTGEERNHRDIELSRKKYGWMFEQIAGSRGSIADEYITLLEKKVREYLGYWVSARILDEQDGAWGARGIELTRFADDLAKAREVPDWIIPEVKGIIEGILGEWYGEKAGSITDGAVKADVLKRLRLEDLIRYEEGNAGDAGQLRTLPADALIIRADMDAGGWKTASGYYRVQAGEVLAVVARRADISIEELCFANTRLGYQEGKPGRDLFAGEYLYIPGRRSSEWYYRYTLKAGDTEERIAERFGVPVEVLESYNKSFRELKVGDEIQIPRMPGRGEARTHASLDLAKFSEAAEGFKPYAYGDGDPGTMVTVHPETCEPVGTVKGILTIGYGINLQEAFKDTAYKDMILAHTGVVDGHLVLLGYKKENLRIITEEQREHGAILYNYHTNRISPVSELNDILRNNDLRLNKHEYDAMRDVQYNSPSLAKEVIGRIKNEGRTAAMRYLGHAVGNSAAHKRGLWVRRYNEIRLFLKGVYEYTSLENTVTNSDDMPQRVRFNHNFNDEEVKAFMISYWDLF